MTVDLVILIESFSSWSMIKSAVMLSSVVQWIISFVLDINAKQLMLRPLATSMAISSSENCHP
jgi:hypothetical protein